MCAVFSIAYYPTSRRQSLGPVGADPSTDHLAKVNALSVVSQPRATARKPVYQFLSMLQTPMKDAPPGAWVVVVVSRNVLALRTAMELGSEAVHRAEAVIVAT